MARISTASPYDEPYEDERSSIDDEKDLLLSERSKSGPAAAAVAASPHRHPLNGRQRGSRARMLGILLLPLLLLAVTIWSPDQLSTSVRNGASSYAAGCKGPWLGKSATSAAATTSDSDIVFGLGIGDITGPIVETNMMGYAALPQTNTGLHTRLRARAFIVGSASSAAPPNPAPVDVPADPLDSRGGEPDRVDGLHDRWILLATDLCMGDTAVRRALLARLREAFPGFYGERNVAFLGTHSHSGVAGYHNNLLPTFTSKGVVMDNFNAIVEGSFRAVARAHEDYERRKARSLGAAKSTSRLHFGNVTLTEAHINRSPSAYDFNSDDLKSL